MKKLISCILLLFSTRIFADINYMIVIDAADDVSKLQVLSYEKTNLRPNIKELFTQNALTTLAAYAENPEQAGASLKVILDEAKDKLIQMHAPLNQVAIAVLGTTRMAMLPNNIQEHIYQNVKMFVNDHYPFSIYRLATLTGKELGLYEWLTVNYLSDTFNKNATSLGILHVDELTSTIAYETKDILQEDTFFITVNNRFYKIYSRSISMLGLDSIRQQVQLSDLSSSCYPIDFPMDHNVGHFNFISCANLITEKLLLPTLPSHSEPFIAFDKAFEIYNFLSAEIPDKNAFEARLYYVCSTPWEIMKKDEDYLSEEALSVMCIHSVFIDRLFYDVFSLNSQTLMIKNKINGQIISWPVGFVFFSLL